MNRAYPVNTHSYYPLCWVRLGFDAYVAEFQFRYTNRMNEDIFGTAIEGC
jgi:hypothetical protein